MADDETNTNPQPAPAPDATGTTGAPAPVPSAAGNGGDDQPGTSIEDVRPDVDPNAAKPTQPLERDPEAPREVIRSDLARGLLWLLTITIGAVIFFVGLGQVPSEVLTQSIFPSLVTLTGTALGFYFGAQTAKKD